MTLYKLILLACICYSLMYCVLSFRGRALIQRKYASKVSKQYISISEVNTAISNNIYNITTSITKPVIDSYNSVKETVQFTVDVVTSIPEATKTLIEDIQSVPGTIQNFTVSVNENIQDITATVTAIPQSIDNGVKSVSTTVKKTVELPGRVVNTVASTLKSGIDTYYNIRDKVQRKEIEESDVQKIKIEGKKPIRERNPFEKVKDTFDTVKEGFYLTIDLVNGGIKNAKQFSQQTVEFIEDVQELPDRIDETLQKTSQSIEELKVDLDAKKSAIVSTSEYVWRVVTLEEFKKSFNEFQTTVERVKSNPWTLIKGEEAVARPPRRSRKPAKPSLSPIDKIVSTYNTTVSVASAVGNGFVATGRFFLKAASAVASTFNELKKEDNAKQVKKEERKVEKSFSLPAFPSLNSKNVEPPSLISSTVSLPSSSLAETSYRGSDISSTFIGTIAIDDDSSKSPLDSMTPSENGSSSDLSTTSSSSSDSTSYSASDSTSILSTDTSSSSE